MADSHTPAAGAAPPSVGQQAAAGAFWSTVAGLGARALGLVGTVVIAGLVRPDDFGQVQNAAVLVLTGSQLASLGVGAYIVAFPHAGRAVAFHATCLHLALGAVALALVWALADRLGPAFNTPSFAGFVPGLVIAAFLDRVTFMAERPLARDLRFVVISVSRTAGELAYAGAALATVWQGAGAMAIVYGNLARSIARLGLLLATSSWREWIAPARLRLATVTMLLRFGVQVSVKAVAEFGLRRWDNLLAARAFGPAVSGNYVLAYNLADLPAIQVGEQITDVLLPSFARLPPEQRPAALLRAVALLTLVLAPLTVGLGAVGVTVAAAFFPPEWFWLAPMLTLLPVMLFFRPFGTVYGEFLFAVRGPRPAMLGELGGLVFMVLGTMTIGRRDPMVFVAMVGAAFLARALILMGYAQRTAGVPVLAGLARAAPILLAAAPILVVVPAVRRLLSEHAALLSLAAEVAAGAATYLAGVLLLARRDLRDLVGLVRGVFARRRAA